MPKILVVDDVRDTTDSLVRSLMKAGYDATGSYSEEGAIDLLRRNAYDVIVTDMSMERPDSGLEVLQEAKRLDPHVEVILLTAYGEVKTAVAAMKLGAFDYVEKITEGYNNEDDVYDNITMLVSRCIDRRQNEAMYQVIFKSCVELAYPRQIEIYRERKSDYEIFVDDEYGMVHTAGNEIDIRDLPYRVLVYLMENGGALRSPTRLYQDVWDDPDGWVLAERNPKVLQNRVKARISNLRVKLDLPNIKILFRNERYGLLVPDGVDYCLIKESGARRRDIGGQGNSSQTRGASVEILRGVYS
ncbi:response regulator [Candidatus Poribacteria bacterium]